MNLDGYLFGTVATEGMTQPYFLANTVEAAPSAPDPAGANSATRFTDELDVIDEQHQVAILTRTRGYRLEVARTSHMDFTDDPFFSLRRRLRGMDDAEEVVHLLGNHAVAFFTAVLNGTPPGPPLIGPVPSSRATLRVFR
jgi:hypothetical protein